MTDSDDCQEQEPAVEEQIELLVPNIGGQDTDIVDGGVIPTSSLAIQNTFGDDGECLE